MRGHIAKKVSKSTGKTRYYPVLYLGFGATGKKEYKWLPGHNSNKAAEKALNAAVRELDTGTFVEPSKELFGAYLQRWLEDKKSQVRPDTLQSYKWLVSRHIVPALGRLELSKIRPQDLQSLYANLATGDKPLSSRSVQYVHTIIHNALDRAVKWGIVGRNIADAVDAPRVEKRAATIWTPEHVITFLDYAAVHEEKYYIGFFLAIMTGMRKGEILALRWDHIDWTGGYIQVQRTLKWVNGQAAFAPTKTERSRRSVAISGETIEALREHRFRQDKIRIGMGAEYDDNGLVLARMIGKPLHPKTFDDTWYRAMERAGVPRIRFHDLRHTHASLLLQQGVHPKIVSERLGHSTINITLDTYSHVLPGLQKQVAEDFSVSLSAHKLRQKIISESED